MGTWLGWIAALVAAGAVLAGVVVLAVWITMGRGPEIAAITPRDPAGLPADQVALGAALAAVGDCGVCHTKPDGAPFAGGVGLETPFGTVFSTNITPDPETGIGQWSEADFVRSMTHGLDRAGNHLFPVFPYDHFAKVTEGDLKAIYAYLMTRPDVAEPPPADAWGFPFNQRSLLAWWKWLYLDPSPWAADPALDDEQNRGAYLVSGLGHCGACHTPRTMLGGLDHSRPFAGAEAENWHVPAIGAASLEPAGWTLDAYANYLFDGWDKARGLANGPMGMMVDHLAEANEDDIFAMAAYLASLTPEPDQATLDAALAATGALDWAEGEVPGGANAPTTDVLLKGEQIFATTCVKCHKARVAETQPVSLALSSAVTAPDARNLIHIARDGIVPPHTSRQRTMPAQDRSLSGQDLAALAAFVRWRFTDLPDWTEIAGAIAATQPAAN